MIVVFSLYYELAPYFYYIGDKMKVKVTEVDNNTRIKLKDDDGETVCYIYYNKNMNVLEIKNANKKPIKYIPLGE